MGNTETVSEDTRAVQEIILRIMDVATYNGTFGRKSTCHAVLKVMKHWCIQEISKEEDSEHEELLEQRDLRAIDKALQHIADNDDTFFNSQGDC
ncbi:MAG: hypothetical protein ACXABY_25510 [Candidatus Thorarchaeota archaeon]|jgi:hypothetical protein